MAGIPVQPDVGQLAAPDRRDGLGDQILFALVLAQDDPNPGLLEQVLHQPDEEADQRAVATRAIRRPKLGLLNSVAVISKTLPPSSTAEQPAERPLPGDDRGPAGRGPAPRRRRRRSGPSRARGRSE